MNSKPTFSFYINKLKKAKNEKWPVYMRLTYNRKKIELDTGYYSGLNEWNVDKGRSKNNDTTNDALSTLETRFYDKITEFKKAESLIDLQQLKESITNSVVNTTPKLNDYVTKFCHDTSLRNDIVQATKTRYLQIQNTIAGYLSSIKRDNLLITEVDFKFVNDYDTYIRQADFFGKEIKQNTLSKYHTRFKTIILKAMNEGLISINPYTNFKLKTVPTSRTFLTLEQLTKIEQLELNNLSLDKIRDVFLFSVYTSIRFSDVAALSQNNLYEDANKKLNLKWIIEKSTEQHSVPLLDIPIKIIKKYSNTDECKIKNRLLPGITNQKTNEYLKVIADLAGINMNLTYHIARHTFATTIWLDNGGSMEDLQKILGHKNIRETMIYGKITSNRLNGAFAMLNNKLNNEKKERTPA